MIRVSLSHDKRWFYADGGMAAGRDSIHQVITRWPGWSRLKSSVVVDGLPTSRYRAPINAVTASCLDKAQIQVQWHPEAAERARGLMLGVTKAKRALEPSSTTIHPDLTSFPTARTPFQHQWQAIEACRAFEWRTLIADDMGLGKTGTALWALEDSGCHHALVVCPISVKWNWQREVALALGETWRVLVIDGPPRKRADQFVELFAMLGCPRCACQEVQSLDHLGPGMDTCAHCNHQYRTAKIAVIINYDLLMHLSEDQLSSLREFVLGEAVIADESHYVKSRKAARTQVLTDIANGVMRHPPTQNRRGKIKRQGTGARVRMLLTGTPIRNMPDDLYSQIDLINPGTWTSWWDFVQRHCVTIEMPGRTKNKIVGPRNLEGLNAVVNTLQIKRDKRDVLNLPEKIRTFPEVSLDEPMGKVYKLMRDHARIVLDELDGELSIFQPEAHTAMEVLMRCEQIAQGFVGGVPEPLIKKLMPLLTKRGKAIPGRPNEVMFPEHPKVKWLLETINCLLARDNPVVVFSRFLAPLYWLFEQWPDHRVGLLEGKLTAKAKHNMIESFQNGNIDILFIQVRIAEGFNLTRCQDVIFYGRDWSPAINAQAEARCHRIGTKGTVNVQVPIVRGTIEVSIDAKLRAKEADAEQALRTITIAELKEML